MENNKIIKLDTSTKVLYSLFNFFAPISFVFIGACSLQAYSVLTTLFSLISILVGLFCLISNLVKYNRFLYVNEKNIAICKGKINNPKVIKIFKTENIKSEELYKDLTIKYANKRTKLLHTSFSLLGMICYAGPLIFIPIIKNANVTHHYLVKLHDVLPTLFKTPKNPFEVNNILMNVFAWGFVIFVSAIGCLGLLYTPLYPFLRA